MSDTHLPSDDPFREARDASGVLKTAFRGEEIPMILRHKDIRTITQNWKTFSSDAEFRVPVPSEEDVRRVRQLPIETNPPEHTAYRALIDPFFQQPKEPEFIAKIETLIGGMVAEASAGEPVEVVRNFGIPLQSRAQTYLMKMPESEADVWISWGMHVFREGDGAKKGEKLERYIYAQIDRATASPGEDFFSALLAGEFQGRKLTRDEVAGFATLAFAGGRDTIIQSVAAVLGYFGAHPKSFEAVRAKPAMIPTAAEEFFRMLTPLTHIGRVCPMGAEVHGVKVAPDERVTLCWSSANRDATVFQEPDTMKLDRKPNPHIAFGSGPHTCIGALHARLVVRTLIQVLCEQVAQIEILAHERHREEEKDYTRMVGYESLTVRLHRLER
jgi:cytochrome P450